MLKRFPSDKINGTKNAYFFILRAPAHHCFTFPLQVYIFIQKNDGLFDFKTSQFLSKLK